MSEQLFIDIWIKYGQPEEIIEKEVIFEFLKELNEKTEGLVIVDHFSYKNYDHISRIELTDNYLFIYWKDFEKFPTDDFTRQIFGNYTYMYTLCRIRKIRFVLVDGHIYIIFMPNVSKLKEVKNFLGISKLIEKKEIIVEDNLEELYTAITYVKNNQIYNCILHNLPFFSFLIQPKENSIGVGFSKLVLMIETLDYSKVRLNKAIEKLKRADNDDFDEIHSVGNTARSILESILKYYCIYEAYLLPADDYGKNMLGKIHTHLKNNNDKVLKEYFTNNVIRLANDFSHDIGYFYSKSVAETLCNSVMEILDVIYETMEDKNFG